MAISLAKIKKAQDILKNYEGSNPFITKTKKTVFTHNIRTMNDFEAEYIIENHDKEPIEVNKIVKISDWYGNKLKEEYSLEFVPTKLKVTWYFGETNNMHHFYCIYRRSQEKAVEVFAPKKGILTDFLSEDWTLKEIDFKPYNERLGFNLYPHQEEAVKFLTTKKKGILAHDMGFGKTLAAIVAALEGNFKHVLIISPSSIKETWKRELSHFVDEKDVTVVQGSKWDDAKFTIINYDILDNFYEIPEQTIKTKEMNVDENGNIIKEFKEKKIVSRSKKIIDEAMNNSQLFQSNYDLLIIDEAHRLSNSTSNRFKIIQDLIKRSKPNGIFELTGTMITNSSRNLYNLLKLIDAPVSKDWQHYMERYCGAKFLYKKNERNAYTALFCKSLGKSSWGELTYDEKKKLDEYLEKNCKKICIPDKDTNMEELQEIIKPYYLRRVKEDLDTIPQKTVKYLHYEMDEEEKHSYDELWEKYLELQEDKEKTEKNKKLIEVSLMRQWLADKMIPKTVNLVKKCIEKNHKVVIFCAYDNEINKLKEVFSDCCVYHNGKINEKKKSDAVDKFQNDENIKVFIGNIFSAGVGLTLIASDVVVFNNFSFVPSDCLQCEDRIHRIGQTKPCTVYYQSFNDTYFDKMLEIVHDKQEVIDKIIVSEKEK